MKQPCLLKRSDEALELYDQAAVIYQQVGARLGFANVLQEMGKMQPDLAQGLNQLEQAQAIYTQIQDRYSQSRNLLFIADIQRSLNQPDAALASFDRASILAAKIGYEPLQTYAANKRAELEARPTQPKSQQLGQGLLILGIIAFIGFNLINGHWLLALLLSSIGAIILWLVFPRR